MAALRELLVGFLGENADARPGADWSKQRGLRGADLINFLCFHLDVTPLEKQTLLEALDDRVDCLFDVLTFKTRRAQARPLGPTRWPRQLIRIVRRSQSAEAKVVRPHGGWMVSGRQIFLGRCLDK